MSENAALHLKNKAHSVPVHSSVSSFNKYLILILVVIIAIIGVALFYSLTTPKNNPSQIKENSLAPVSPTPTIPYKEEYQNPFEKKTDYKNPFDNIK